MTLDAIDSGRFGNVTWSLHYDESPSTPREWMNLTTLYGFTREYDFGDEPTKLRNWAEDYGSESDEWAGLLAELVTERRSPIVYAAPIRMDDFGANGIRLVLGDTFVPRSVNRGSAFYVPDRAAGLVVVFADDQETCGTPDGLIAGCVQGELWTYEDYLNGSVYGYVVERMDTCNLGHEHGTVLDSCWGYFGLDDCRTVAIESAEQYAEEVSLSST